MKDEDADALAEMCHEEEVYRYVPTFLYEQKYADKHMVIAKMDEECFDTKESLLLGIYLKDTCAFAGIAEVYAYEPERRKCSVGVRLMKEYWGGGIAGHAELLMRRYLLDQADMRIITAHVMQENKASGRVLLKNGFEKRYTDILEDWGFEEPVLIDKYIIKLPK
jgi:ribosomal-protein-alanine N-acetyltransferase